MININNITEGLSKPWGELALYHQYALDMASGKLPYLDFFPEYPPLALWIFKIPLIFGTWWYMLGYYALVALVVIATVVLIKKMKGNPFIFLASVLALGGLFWDRFDIFPAFFSVLAFYLLMRKQYTVSLLSLSLGVLIKIFPVIFLPIVLIRVWIDRGFKQMLVGIAIFLFPIAFAISAINNYGGMEGLLRLINYHKDRGTQIESLKATPLIWKHLRGEYEANVEYKHATFEIK